MKMLSILILALVAAIFAGACTADDREALRELAGPTTKCTAAQCSSVVAAKTVNVSRGVLACCLLLGSCTFTPTPVPPDPSAMGGSPSTGGAASTGGARATGGMVATGGASSLTLCQQACANLARLGCPEDQATCPAQCELNSKDSRFTQNIQCRINATSKAAIQACGIASCR